MQTTSSREFDLEAEVEEDTYYGIGYMNYVDGKIGHSDRYDKRKYYR